MAVIKYILYFVALHTCFAAALECDSNEIQDDCPAFCKAYSCPKSEEESRAPCEKPATCPAPSCKSQCSFNHRRDDNGTCIPTTDCPPFDCSSRPNERFDPCPPLCPTDDCSQATPDGRCPPIFGNIGIVLECSPTCRCIEGYWRKDGVCVPYAKCGRTHNIQKRSIKRTKRLIEDFEDSNNDGVVHPDYIYTQ